MSKKSADTDLLSQLGLNESNSGNKDPCALTGQESSLYDSDIENRLDAEILGSEWLANLRKTYIKTHKTPTDIKSNHQNTTEPPVKKSKNQIEIS